jgi:flagellar biosynthetic protein FlhB
VGSKALGGFALATLRHSAAALADGPLTVGDAAGVLRTTALGLVGALLPFAVGVTATAALVGALQARGVFSAKPLAPKWSHVDPVAGLRRIVSPEAIAHFLKAMAKVAALGAVTYVVIAGSWPGLVALTDAGPAAAAAVTRSLVTRLAVVTGVAFFAVAAFDYGFQWFRHEKSLRMTREEVVREHRETEGDPLVKARLTTLARAQARKRMLRRVPGADVVVVNPTHVAVALRYDPQVAPAPVVVAMGERKLAERIKALALAAGVPVIENPPVARALLATGAVGRPIPPALYAAVAEILAFVYRRRAAERGLPVGVTR